MRHALPGRKQKFAYRPTDVGERVVAFVRRLHPSRTIDNVVADLEPWGIHAGTVARMLERKTAPGAILWLALIWAYGPEFLAEVHPAPLGWLSVASREQKRATLEHAMAKLRAEMDSLE